ncbi:hypothetical protein B0H14DRAFT_3607863 [Mycena olivaceomarginata]|nr:hypothetical protein B0H14DRAFT_3607863 [Mycena olivaceomarginata]
MSTTHGFFFAMGGFVSASGHRPIVHEEQLCARPEYLTAIRDIRAEYIEDKSKRDLLSKGVVVLQGLWFAAQCLARIQQRLPLTELEVATLAVQSVNISIWFLWWHKPLDVRHKCRAPLSEVKVVEVVTEAAAPMLMGACVAFDPVISVSVPWFWSTHGFYPTGPGKGDPRIVSIFTFVQFLVGTVFGVIHCAAWNAHFPIADEMLLWRSCALVVSATPFGVTSLFLLSLLTRGRFPAYSIGTRKMFRAVAGRKHECYHSGLRRRTAPSYYALLRDAAALPAPAFLDVNWSLLFTTHDHKIRHKAVGGNLKKLETVRDSCWRELEEARNCAFLYNAALFWQPCSSR